jgi:hypothetical protein
MKTTIFWDVMPSSVIHMNQCFRETFASISRVDLLMTDVNSLRMLTSSKTIQWHNPNNPNPHIHVSSIFNLGIQYKMDRQILVDTFQNSLKG